MLDDMTTIKLDPGWSSSEDILLCPLCNSEHLYHDKVNLDNDGKVRIGFWCESCNNKLELMIRTEYAHGCTMIGW